MSKTRNSNIELLRIFATLGVIVLHYNNDTMGGGFGYVEMYSINSYLMYFLENVFICAVNVFMLISGCFMSEKKSIKTIRIAELVFQVIVFNAATLLLRIISNGGMLSLKDCINSLLPNNYYVTLYAVVYLLSPYINLLLEKLTDIELKNLTAFLFVVFSIWPTFLEIIESIVDKRYSGMNTIGISGSDGGYTIVNFIMMYIFGAYLRRESFKKSPAYYLVRLVICWFIQTAASYIASVTAFGTGSIWAYCNPFVILSAVYAFLLFSNLKKIKSKWINSLAKASFSVYLLHMMFLRKIKIEIFATANVFVYLVHVIVACVGIYMICFVVYKVYSVFEKMIFQKVEQFVKLPDVKCGE